MNKYQYIAIYLIALSIFFIVINSFYALANFLNANSYYQGYTLHQDYIFLVRGNQSTNEAWFNITYVITFITVLIENILIIKKKIN